MNKPDISSFDYTYGIFAKIGRKGWTIEQIQMWCDKNNVYYESTDKRIDLIERIKDAGYK